MIVLLRQRLRRDRWQLVLWIGAATLLTLAGYSGVTQSYGTASDRAETLAAVLANPVILMFRGLPSGTSAGAFVAFEILPWLAMLAALMSMFLAVRHTRGDEEAGRGELLAATAAGRSLPTVAALVHGAGANVVLALLSGAALAATGLDTANSLLLGAAAGATGIAFLGIGMLCAQLFRSSHAANAAAVWLMMIAFLLRGIGNAAGTPSSDLTRIDSSWISWSTPFGWAEQTRPFDGGTAWPAALGVVIGLAVAVVSLVVQSRRDLGAGVFGSRPGRPARSPALASSFGLAWRLSRGSLLGWAIGGALTGLLATTLSTAVDSIAGQNPAVTQILERISGSGALDDAMVTVFFTVLGVLAACAAVQTLSRARLEEARGTAEPVLAAAVSRIRWFAGHTALAVLAALLVVAAGAVAAVVGLRSGGGDDSLLRVVLVSALGQLVAASVFTALAALLFVLVPRASIAIGWALVGIGTVLGLFGPLFGVPEWASDLSPFAVVPLVSHDAVDVRGLWWLIAVVVVVCGAAVALMRRRELVTDG